ncbi:hypothetical protein [Asinibacterium sp. OR53]|uniref:hypothetical protein n=1 Tax=Asinibacterium sp. OR53 TaxID=925409 RepID=UPI00047892AF|nr:hypothetical protein [Asinibacterium sp. OR53]
MHTLTLEISDTRALLTLQQLAKKKAIKIIASDEVDDSLSLPGTPVSMAAFKQWIANAEATPTISLKTAKSEWGHRRKRLLHGLGK